MKKIVMIIAFVACTAFYTTAQTKNGDLVLSTMLNFSGGYGYGSLYLQGSINPGIHYLLTNKLAIGASVDLNAGGILRNGSFNYYNSRSFSVGPYARYYFGSKKFQPFLELGVGYNTFKANYNSMNVDQSYHLSGSGFYLRPAVGFSSQLTDRISFEGKVSLDAINTSYHSNQHNLSSKIGVGIKIGK
jgi:hypothetical protein